ncbi:MAG: hypothetical protein AAGF12_23665 [Myxococcota bacterium]
MDLDIKTAHDAYLKRFVEAFGEKPDGSFVKFGKHMVQKLAERDFGERLRHYLNLHQTSRDMLSSGATINDAIVMEFEEAAAWLCLQAPNMLAMFSGEMGDPEIAKGTKPPT